MKFQRYFSYAHLNGANIALYNDKDGVVARIEEVGTGKRGSSRRFRNEGLARQWYEALPGSGLGRLANALDDLNDK